MSCDRCGNALGTRPVLEMAEMFHQRPGVDSHGTGNLTGSVARTGLDGVIVQVRENLRRHSRGFRLSRHLTPQRDPLSWGSRQVSTRTDVLAKAALNAAVDGGLNCGGRLQILKMAFRILGQYDPRREDVLRISKSLQFPH